MKELVIKVKVVFAVTLLMLLIVDVLGQELNATDEKVVRRCGGSVFAVFHSSNDREFVRLMNLARTNPELLRKYIYTRYDSGYIDRLPWNSMQRSSRFGPRTLLHHSLGLHMSALYNNIGNGLKGKTGHQYFNDRLILGLNFNTLLTGIARGENCEYGSRHAVDIFINLMNSPGHRANILNPDFMRVGVSRKHHRTFGVNTVSVFSGPKWHDRIFPSVKVEL
ncbi:MAG TPA: CAP domain-containing protein [Ohtaekwangia sp.]|nr:CAP domain-containing protein [Ohtaekwangia sp.]